MKDYFSLIKWNTDFTYLPVDRELLVICKDDRGDNPYYYTTVAWIVNNKPGEDAIWISNNEQIFDEVLMWSYMPEYDALKIFD